MKVLQLLDKYGITQNPFAQEDAQSDGVFRDYCLDDVHHPAWDKIYGGINDLSTSVVFGEKGSGKTALKLQMIDSISTANKNNPDKKVWVVTYDDFNSFLDEFKERLSGRRRRPENALKYWELSDHMDSIISLATTKLIDLTIQESHEENSEAFSIPAEKLEQLGELEVRDFLLLATIYDRSHDQSRLVRWGKVKKKLKYKNWAQYQNLLIGILATLAILGGALGLGTEFFTSWWKWILGGVFASWLPYMWEQFTSWNLARKITNQVRVVDNKPSVLKNLIMKIAKKDLANQPLPVKRRNDNRYDLLTKLQHLLKKLGFQQLVVIVDRVDEPHLIDGHVDRMRELIWPLFDNKFLKHTEISCKLLLPSELYAQLQKQDKQFYERSRLDKQNLIPSLSWTGEALYDIVNRRLKACAKLAEKPPVLEDLFDPISLIRNSSRFLLL